MIPPRLRTRGLLALIAGLALLLAFGRPRAIDAPAAVRIAADRLAADMAAAGQGPPDIVGVDVHSPGWTGRPEGYGMGPEEFDRLWPKAGGYQGRCWCVGIYFAVGRGLAGGGWCAIAPDGTVVWSRFRTWEAPVHLRETPP